MRVTVTDSQIKGWRLQGYSLERIASACQTTTCAISHRILRIWQREQNRDPDPDEDEIARRCAEIQREWSELERQRREVGRSQEWRPAVVHASVLTLAGG
jgi:hypothetical protein